MFKKTIAIMLAAVMLLQPVAASAVSWGEVVSSLQETGGYYGEETTATKDEEGKVTVTGGTVSDVYIDDSIAGTYVFVDVTIDGESFSIFMDEKTAEAFLEGETTVNVDRAFVEAYSETASSTLNVGEGAQVDAGEIWLNAYEGGDAALVNDGAITAVMGEDAGGNQTAGWVFARGSGEGSSLSVANGENGTINAAGEVTIYAQAGTEGTFSNEGEIDSPWVALHAGDGSTVTGTNEGTIKISEFLDVGASSINDETGEYGDKATASFVNNGEITGEGYVDEEGNFYYNELRAFASGDAETSVTNNGTLDGTLGVVGGNGNWDGDREATAPEDAEYVLNITNNGTVTDGINVSVWENGTVTTTNNGETGWMATDVNEAGGTSSLINEGTVSGFVLGGAYEGAVNVTNSGEAGWMNGWADSSATVNATITETGSVGNVWIDAVGEGKATVTNDGTVGGLGVGADGNGQMALTNNGTVTNDMYGNAAGEGQTTVANNGAVEGDLWASAWEGGSTTATNDGSVGFFGADAYDEAATTVTNNGTAGGAWAGAYYGGDVSMTNNGAVEGQLNAGTDGGSSIAVKNGENGTAGSNFIFIGVPEGENISSEQIAKAIAGISFAAGTEIMVFSGEEVTGIYVVDENGSVILLEEEVKTPEHDGPDYDRIRHQMEEKRKQQAIGGVYGSPYWVKQLYLGYHSLNLRLYEDGEQLLFKQSLSWKDGGPEKRLTLRAEIEEPQDLMMRLDGEVIEILERTEITVITLVDKNNQPYMEYSVADLKGAREMYGLERGDLLCVGSADAEVMKIGADGQMVPVEQETEVATDSEAATE